MALCRLGVLHTDAQRLTEAGVAYEQALAHAREGGYRQLEGMVLGGLADIEHRQGRVRESIEILRKGEALLREISDREALAPLLCIRGRAEVAAGDRSGAAVTLAEAESMAKAMGSTPDTDLGRQLAALRAALT